MAVKQEFDPKKESAAIMEKALSGRGFVLFVGVVTDKKDKDGNFILDFHYIRNRYAFEDVAKAVSAFREQSIRDAMAMMAKQA